MTLKSALVAQTQMLIRKPVAEVFEDFVDPAITALEHGVVLNLVADHYPDAHKKEDA